MRALNPLTAVCAAAAGLFAMMVAAPAAAQYFPGAGGVPLAPQPLAFGTKLLRPVLVALMHAPVFRTVRATMCTRTIWFGVLLRVPQISGGLQTYALVLCRCV